MINTRTRCVFEPVFSPLQHTETLNIVFLVYFRILKKAQKSVLLPAVLEGLAKYLHSLSHTHTHK